MSVPKIVEITYAIYQRLSKIQLSKVYVGRKVNKVSEFNFRQNFPFACSPTLSPRIITWRELTIDYCLVSGQLQKTHDLDELLT